MSSRLLYNGTSCGDQFLLESGTANVKYIRQVSHLRLQSYGPLYQFQAKPTVHLAFRSKDMESRIQFVFLFFTVLNFVSCFPGVGLPYQQGSATTARLASAAPTTASADCIDLNNGVYPSCWDALGMTEWMLTWNQTTTTCKEDEIWSKCYMRLATGSPRLDCSVVGSQACIAPETSTLGENYLDPHVIYGAYTIWGKHVSRHLSSELIRGTTQL